MSEATTHDPLCAKSPTGVHYIGVCTCDLIAKVRADERYEAFKRARRFLSNNYPAGLFMTAAEFASHAIRNTPFDELPKYLQREFEK